MDVIPVVMLTIIGTLSPFMLAVAAWARNVSAKLQALHIDMVESSARQDALLAEHDRRIGAIEIVLLSRND